MSVASEKSNTDSELGFAICVALEPMNLLPGLYSPLALNKDGTVCLIPSPALMVMVLLVCFWQSLPR